MVKNTKDIEARNVNGLIPLQLAIQDSQPEMAKILIENGANIKAECEKHVTLFDSTPPLIYDFYNH